MQPRWLPTLRAGIGVAVLLTLAVMLVLTWPWRLGEVLMALVWVAFGVFLIWASRREHSGTRLEAEAIVVTTGRRPRQLTRDDILDLRTDGPPERSWRVQAVLRDGEVVTLLGVPPGELGRLRRWHVGPR